MHGIWMSSPVLPTTNSNHPSMFTDCYTNRCITDLVMCQQRSQPSQTLNGECHLRHRLCASTCFHREDPLLDPEDWSPVSPPPPPPSAPPHDDPWAIRILQSPRVCNNTHAHACTSGLLRTLSWSPLSLLSATLILLHSFIIYVLNLWWAIKDLSNCAILKD